MTYVLFGLIVKNKSNLEQFKYKVVKVLKVFTDSNFIVEIENLINLHDSDWMKKFRELFPNLKSHQYRLAVYLYLNFSPAAIAILTGKQRNNVYVDKSKLKDEILSLDPEVAGRLLKSLHMTSVNTDSDDISSNVIE